MPHETHKVQLMTSAADVGRMVRELRERRSMTQRELATEMKTAQSVISRIEAGSNLTIDTLQAVADAMSADLSIEFSDRAVRAA